MKELLQLPGEESLGLWQRLCALQHGLSEVERTGWAHGNDDEKKTYRLTGFYWFYMILLVSSPTALRVSNQTLQLFCLELSETGTSGTVGREVPFRFRKISKHTSLQEAPASVQSVLPQRCRSCIAILILNLFGTWNVQIYINLYCNHFWRIVPFHWFPFPTLSHGQSKLTGTTSTLHTQSAPCFGQKGVLHGWVFENRWAIYWRNFHVSSPPFLGWNILCRPIQRWFLHTEVGYSSSNCRSRAQLHRGC